MSDKEQLPLAVSSRPRARPARRWLRLLGLVFLATQVWLLYLRATPSSTWLPHVLEHTDDARGVCPQVTEYDPKDALNGRKIQQPTVRKSVERLRDAVRVDTTVGDTWADPSDDPKTWRAFSEFAKVLEKSFPAIHDNASLLQREIVHEHGLLYTWPGSDPSLKPLLLMAHQDVVPVDPTTRSEWQFPPFSGYIDTENQTVWGRGSVDCKLWLLGTMSAVESLLESGWEPRRTILLAYGFDEEASGTQGAQQIAKYLHKRYGDDSVSMIVDEGMPVYSAYDAEAFGAPIAAPAVDEKGALDVRVEVRSKGGHSSMPPPHTSIGLLSKLVTVLEEHPFPDKLEERSKAQIRFFQCMRDHPLVPKPMRLALEELEYAERALESDFVRTHGSKLPLHERLFVQLAPASLLQSRLKRARQHVLDVLSPAVRLMLKTTQAADIVQGGVKVNALPESAYAIMNHRIATYSSVNETKERYKKLLTPVAEEMGLSMTAFGEELLPLTNTSVGSLVISNGPSYLEVVDVSPFEGKEAGAFRLLASVIRQTWHLDEPRRTMDDDLHRASSTKQKHGESIRVTPTTMFANTDTHWYKMLTRNIFRFGPATLHRDLTGLTMLHTIHTVNEHVSFDAIAKAVEFYTNLIVAVDYEDVNKM